VRKTGLMQVKALVRFLAGIKDNAEPSDCPTIAPVASMKFLPGRRGSFSSVLRQPVLERKWQYPSQAITSFVGSRRGKMSGSRHVYDRARFRPRRSRAGSCRVSVARYRESMLVRGN